MPEHAYPPSSKSAGKTGRGCLLSSSLIGVAGGLTLAYSLNRWADTLHQQVSAAFGIDGLFQRKASDA